MCQPRPNSTWNATVHSLGESGGLRGRLLYIIEQFMHFIDTFSEGLLHCLSLFLSLSANDDLAKIKRMIKK